MKRVKIVLAVLAAALVGVTTWHLPRTREPIYQGKPLSSWLLAYREDSTGKEEEEAVLEAGTNAIPTLLRMLRAKDSPLKIRLMSLLQKQKVFKIEYTPAAKWKTGALRGFEILRGKAQSAVPTLVEIANQDNSPECQHIAVWALCAIGPPAKAAVPSLLKLATNSDENIRLCAIFALDSIHAEPDKVTPVLIRALNDPSPHVRPHATNVLRNIDPEAAAKAGITNSVP